MSRRALLAAAVAFAFSSTAFARVPEACKNAPVSVRCVKALWRAAHARPAVATNAPEGAEERRDSRAPAKFVPYAGPPPVAAADPVKSPPLRTMPVIPPPKRGEHDERREPARPALPKDARPADTTRQFTMGPVRSAPAPAGASFEGIGVGLPGFSVAANPPDVNGRVGATQYVQWNNLSFAIWDKTGKLLFGPAAGNTPFQAVSGPCATHNDGDPVVSYDILAGRWILSQFAVEASPGFSHQCVAVSLTDDATGAYYVYDFVTDQNNFVDYPHLAFWPDGYYMSAHVFDAAGSSYLAGRIYVFERDKMLKGQTARLLSADLKEYNGQAQYGFLPADVDSALPPPAGEAEFVLGPDPSSTSTIDSTRVAVTWGATPSITLTETTISSGWSLAPCVNGGRACVPQPPPAGASAYLDSLDQHFMHRLAYRNFGGSPAQESLVANMTVTGSASTPAHGAIRWFEFRNAGNSTTTPTVYQAATFDPDTAYRWMGSIAMDRDHDIVLGYSKSSTSINPSIFVNGRLGSDPLNTLGAETQMTAGGGVQLDGGGNRWGDYSAMSLDPIDQCTFWYTNEYIPASGSFNWATRIASFKYPSCAGATWGTLSGTITSCATGLPVSGVLVTLDNGYSGTSDAGGHYSIFAPAGTYAATVSAADRNCTSSSPATVSVIVPGNGSVSQSFCVSGTSRFELGTVTLNDQTSGNGNGVVNRSECILANVTIANNGCADDANISATLTTSTPGVTVTQPSAFYPDLAVGASGAGSAPFRFQTEPAFVCGTIIAFTLNLTSAAGSQSVSFTVPTCASGGVAIPAQSLTTSDAPQGDRLFRDGEPSTCNGKACAGGFGGGGTYNYKAFPFTNNASTAACVTVTITGACGTYDVESVAYAGSTYTPPASAGDPKSCTNFLGDAGVSTVSGPISYSFTVPAHSSFVVVVNTVNPGTSCTQFSGTVTGLIDDTPGPGACPTCTPPPAPSISASGPTTFCPGGSVTLTSSAAGGNQWYRNGAAINGATGTTYAAAASGSYRVVTTANGCASAPSAATVVTVSAAPATPTATNTGPYCTGATISLSTPAVANATYAWTGPNAFTSSQQNPTIANATAANAGTYSVTVAVNGCPSAAGATNVVVNAAPPATPTAANGGPYCIGATIALSTPTVAGATYAWTGPNGFTSTLQNPTIANATAAMAGTYSVTLSNGCTSAAGTTSVTVNPLPDATMTGALEMGSGPGGVEQVPDAGSGAIYAWTITNGTITAGQGTRSISFSSGAAGKVTVGITVTNAQGCSAASSRNVTIGPLATAVSPIAGRTGGGAAVTITGSGFQNGATVTFGGVAATNVVVVNSTTITATAPPHAAGAVDVVVTNPDNYYARLASSFTYSAQIFDPNGDHTIDPADVFYLINYVFGGGPLPQGAAGTLSGDANGDGVVDPADVFYIVNYVYGSGAAPLSLQPHQG